MRDTMDKRKATGAAMLLFRKDSGTEEEHTQASYRLDGPTILQLPPQLADKIKDFDIPRVPGGSLTLLYPQGYWVRCEPKMVQNINLDEEGFNKAQFLTKKLMSILRHDRRVPRTSDSGLHFRRACPFIYRKDTSRRRRQSLVGRGFLPGLPGHLEPSPLRVLHRSHGGFCAATGDGRCFAHGKSHLMPREIAIFQRG